jgi:hypothetical protein
VVGSPRVSREIFCFPRSLLWRGGNEPNWASASIKELLSSNRQVFEFTYPRPSRPLPHASPTFPSKVCTAPLTPTFPALSPTPLATFLFFHSFQCLLYIFPRYISPKSSSGAQSFVGFVWLVRLPAPRLSADDLPERAGGRYRAISPRASHDSHPSDPSSLPPSSPHPRA